MLSVLYGIQTDSIVNYSITKNFNERDAIHFLIKDLNKNSIVILDRGYYFIKKNLFVSNQIHCIMRLKKDANKIIKTFYDSNKTSQIINIYLCIVFAILGAYSIFLIYTFVKNTEDEKAA